MKEQITKIATGARPIGASSKEDAAANVQQMFDTIAPSYDKLNHILSIGIDRWWWWRAARVFRRILNRPEAVVLDLCCGTGDMTMALYKHRPKMKGAAPILALDFSHEMLSLGAIKFAFGFRNLANYEDGLAELFRVLRPGGQIGILECNQPDGIVGALYSLYFRKVLPRLGGMISGEPGAYTYLPESVARFPRPPRMKQLIAAAGFKDAAWTGYTFGTAGLYRGTKP